MSSINSTSSVKDITLSRTSLDVLFSTEGIPSILTQSLLSYCSSSSFSRFHSIDFNNEHAPEARRLSIQALLFF